MTTTPIQRSPTTAAPRVAARTHLVETLRARGWATDGALDAAQIMAESRDGDLGDVLIAHGWARPEHVSAAEADLWQMAFANLARDGPSQTARQPEDLAVFLKHRIMPWRRVGDLTAYVTSQPETAREAMAELAPQEGDTVCLMAEKTALDRAMLETYGPELAERAAQRTPSQHSVRSLGLFRHVIVGVILILALGFAMSPDRGMAAIGFLLLLLSVTTTTVRLLALLCSGRSQPSDQVTAGVSILADRRPLPKISVMVPLYKEAQMIPALVKSLSKLDYPRERLDVILLLEKGDETTVAAAMAADLPPWLRVIVAPDGGPRTKPRAMNLALDFCDGDIIGIFDAEDHPEPDQLRLVAERFRSTAPDVACIQCQLAFYNPRENWVTRCFQMEYAIWFDVLLRGWQHLGLPLPLGGTSVYFRASALRAVGAWDAHNVTEDADLGMRLARMGLRTHVLSSTTFEEANCRILPWIRQRSRWLKGYMMTWLNHMRKPRDLWNDLGPAGFFGFQVLFIGGAASYLAMPLFWIALASTLFLGERVYGDAFPDWAFAALGVCLFGGQAVMLTAAALALGRRRALGLALWIPTLPLYWTIGAAAAWKAVVELATAPYYWDKTQHGISTVDAPSEQTGNPPSRRP